jgi:uncharacterized protein YdhG (YjbR/CyaY superfamily)
MAFTSVDEYLAAQPDEIRDTLATVRKIIRSAVPDSAESISYDMPTYKRGGKRFVHFAGWPKHYALYAMNERIREQFKDELKAYHVDNSTIRFRYGEPVPSDLISRLVRARAGLGA